MTSSLSRIVASTGVPDIVERLVQLPGADFTSLMLHVARERAAAVTTPQLVHRYRTDRFLGPSAIPFPALRAAEDAVLRALPGDFEVLALGPLAPLGAHSAIATVDQNKVVTTVRGSEVAADPTNVLALEAAGRRHADPRSEAVVHLAAIQRVVRAQPVDGIASFAHFLLLGMVSAGRDRGSRTFECEAAVRHVKFHTDALLAAGGEAVRVELTMFDEPYGPVADAVRVALAGVDRVEVVDNPHRETGRGYYEGFCFKTHVGLADRVLELGDGGFVDWTRRLTGSRKERCLISGIGLERLALLTSQGSV